MQNICLERTISLLIRHDILVTNIRKMIDFWRPENKDGKKRAKLVTLLHFMQNFVNSDYVVK